MGLQANHKVYLFQLSERRNTVRLSACDRSVDRVGYSGKSVSQGHTPWTNRERRLVSRILEGVSDRKQERGLNERQRKK